MFFNTGTLIFFFIFAGCLLLLILSLIIVGLISKKKGISKGAKAVVILISILTCASLAVYPFVYHNFIDINLRFGYYSSTINNDKIKITRDSVEYHTDGQSQSDKRGMWKLKSNNLVLDFGSEKQTYYVKNMGTNLTVDGVVVFKYMKDNR